MALPAEGAIAIVAGGGALPGLLVDALGRAGREARVLALRGFAAPAIRRRADAVVDLADVPGALARLADWRPAAVALAGGVSRPSPAAFVGAAAAWRNRAEIAEIFARGDDHLLRGVVALLEERGHRVVGAHEIAPDLLAPRGRLGAVRPAPEHRRAAATGFACLRALSPFDVGQAAVVADRRLLAVEGPEGTDRMLARVGALARPALPFGRAKPCGGVLVKAAKAGQDLRVDLATVGPRTVEAAARAGLAGIAIGAGATLLVERERAAAAADRLGLFLVGADPYDPEAEIPA